MRSWQAWSVRALSSATPTSARTPCAPVLRATSWTRAVVAAGEDDLMPRLPRLFDDGRADALTAAGY